MPFAPPKTGGNFSETSFISFTASGPQLVRRHFQFPFTWAHASNSRHAPPHRKIFGSGQVAPHTHRVAHVPQEHPESHIHTVAASA